MSDETLQLTSNPRTLAHAKIFYLQILFAICTFIFGSRAILTPHIPFFAWLPGLLLLFDSTLAFASLLYLDFSRENTVSYLRLSLSLIIFRFSCAFVLFAELFLPHSDPTISVPLIFVALLHCTFSVLSAAQVHNLTNSGRDSTLHLAEPDKMQLGSMTTLVTNIDDEF
ncbi:unnamed protein product [Caenorhabditis bovis]|uniref:Uncharacterized protein n=1 Tax=Caenorhabditis bovis TaxID=2654633 RepID=A0A8S1EB65_9PELO|nr:unnamed protein product [Caenorhabditis bovis]